MTKLITGLLTALCFSLPALSQERLIAASSATTKMVPGRLSASSRHHQPLRRKGLCWAKNVRRAGIGPKSQSAMPRKEENTAPVT